MDMVIKHIEYFNSHPHEEDDDTEYVIAAPEAYFNSHPHEEDDDCLQWYPIDGKNISTHILTKRMTMTYKIDVLDMLFQLTSSRRG